MTVSILITALFVCSSDFFAKTLARRPPTGVTGFNRNVERHLSLNPLSDGIAGACVPESIRESFWSPR
jgi:hypothetical protein